MISQAARKRSLHSHWSRLLPPPLSFALYGLPASALDPARDVRHAILLTLLAAKLAIGQLLVTDQGDGAVERLVSLSAMAER